MPKKCLGPESAPLIEHFFLCSHKGKHEDIKVQIIGHCDPNDQEAREDFWIFHLDTLHPQGLNQKRASKSVFKLKNKLIKYFNEHFWFNSSRPHIQKCNCLNNYEDFYIKFFKIKTQAIKI